MIKTQEIIYGLKVKENTFKGYGFLAHNSNLDNKPKPAILIAPDWCGRTKYFCDKAIQMAELGYIGFACDIYGNKQTAETTTDKRALMYPLRENRKECILRMQSAFNALVAHPLVDPNKIIAIGYCFGGMCVLDLARSGVDVKGVISFHGLLDSINPPLKQSMTSKVLVLHGYEDIFVSPVQMIAFADEMSKANVDWQIHTYGGVQHNFTNPSHEDPKLGLKFDPNANQRSWNAAMNFIEEII